MLESFKIFGINYGELTQLKLTIERRSLIKQQILMYKTAVYTLVSGAITHHKPQISKKGYIAEHYIDTYRQM